MSAAESRAVITRLGDEYRELGDEWGTYALVALSMLADSAPEVVTFILDRVDAKLAEMQVTS